MAKVNLDEYKLDRTKLTALGIKVGDDPSSYAGGHLVTTGESLWYRCFIGIESALVQAGLVQSEWLPGKPGNLKTVAYIYVRLDGSWYRGGREADADRSVNITRRGKTRFEVVWHPSARERSIMEHQERLKEQEKRECRELDPEEWKNGLVMLLGFVVSVVSGHYAKRWAHQHIHHPGYSIGLSAPENFQLAEDDWNEIQDSLQTAGARIRSSVPQRIGDNECLTELVRALLTCAAERTGTAVKFDRHPDS